MKGYKIAFHDEHRQGTDVLNGLHYEYTVTRIPVLIVLDIPDDAIRSTPENRYTVENMTKMRDKWRTNPHKMMPPYADTALRDCAAYVTYKDEDPLTIYNEWFREYCPGFTEFVHASKCRCSKAKVVDIVGVFNGMHYTRATSTFDSDFRYTRQGTVCCPDFGDYSLMAVCAPGIHYFEYPAFAILYLLLLEGGDFANAARTGKIDSRLYETYLTEELNTLKREDKAIEYCKADVAGIEKLFEESCRNSAYGLSIPSGKDEDNEG